MANLFDLDDDVSNVDVIDAEIESLVDGDDESTELTPRSNPDFFGHEEVEKQLLDDYLGGRMPHAIILAGASGIGKATLAFRLTRFLFSQDESQAGMFGDEIKQESLFVSTTNPVFRRVVSLGHADLLVIEREFDEKKGRFKTEISVDAVRRIHPFLQKTAAEGGWRVVIVDGAEALNRSSQNALLKILEEPPKNTLLILTTSKPGAFLPTIRSRCRTINMKPLADDVMNSLLSKMLPNLDMDEKNILNHVAEGSIGKAIRFYNEDGVKIYSQLLDIIATIPELDMLKVHDLAEKFGRYGSEQGYYTIMDILLGMCETQARSLARGVKLSNSLDADSSGFENMINIYPKGHFLNAWDKISKLSSDVDRYNLDKRQGIMGAFLALQDPNYSGIAV